MQAWVTSEGGRLENPGFTLVRGGEKRTLAGRWLEIEAPDGVGIQAAGGRYRGRILVYLNDRGLLNVINELPLEDYLRGVVPREMGPELYDQIEALKAQSVAARTYALRNLGEFSNEGYDICSTPRCQVYGGMSVEHRVSDRAIAETAGQVVLFDGRPAETFYSATCGGHTENVEVVFPLKRGEYLKGVPCMEAGERQIAGASAPGLGFPRALTEQLLPPPAGPPHAALAARLVRLAKLAGLPAPQDELGSVERAEVASFLAWGFDLVLAPRILSPGIDVRDPPASWRPHDVRFAGFLAESGLLAEPRDQELDGDERETLLYELAVYLGVLRSESAHFLELDEGELTVRTSSGRRTWRLPEKLSTLRRLGSALVSAPLSVAAGDRLDLYWSRDRLVGLVQPVEAAAVSLGRRAPKQRWSRFVTRGELRRVVEIRYPGFPFEGFEVLARGVSGRVGKLRLLGQDGRAETVEGLAVRWTLDVPDTLFEASRRQDDLYDGWYFEGRGWGHGVGMCQAGAFGMAKRRLGYREILEHYYSGVELGVVRQVRERVFLGP
jgi:stage II sporulation protein D